MDIRFLSLTLTALTLGGCTADTTIYPSLQPRPIEGRSDAEPVVETPVAAPDPALDAKVKRAADTLATERAAFDAVAQTTTPRIRAGARAAQGSDAWLNAQTALAELDEHRARMLDLLGELEQLAIARATEGVAPYPALIALQAEVETELARETTALDALKRGLSAS